MRRLLILTLPLFLAGCLDTGMENPTLSPPAEPVPGPSLDAPGMGGLFGEETRPAPETVASGSFTEKGPDAITYDPRLVPEGATAQVATGRTADGITVRLAVTGMLPRRTYGAHLHTRPCTDAPASAGPHYQHNPDPAASASPPSVDPSYANPQNEVWLDFTPDREGAATATAVQKWQFDEMTPPRSVVVHISRTRTDKGFAGNAGERVACLSLPG